MRSLLRGLAILAALAAPASADEAADCAAGIETIKAALAKGPAEDAKAKLEKYLKDAEREMGEKEYDECLEAVEDAKEFAGG
jgi:hypothetical protein